MMSEKEWSLVDERGKVGYEEDSKIFAL